MTLERVPGGPMPDLPPLGSVGDPTRINLRLQVLSTEHWGLLSARSLSWNETFTRAAMFLSALSGAIVALALVAQATAFGDAFAAFALVVLPVVFFLGLATFLRLGQAGREDFRWVVGMNRIRAAYLQIVPEVAPYLVNSPHDDYAGVIATMGTAPGRRNFLFGLVTTPGVVVVIDSVVAGAIVAIAAGRLGATTPAALAAGAGAAFVLVGLGLAYAYRVVTKWFEGMRPLNPTPAPVPAGAE
jgi:hypothetical protein